jgi:hypothetical protein
MLGLVPEAHRIGMVFIVQYEILLVDIYSRLRGFRIRPSLDVQKDQACQGVYSRQNMMCEWV